MLVFSNSLKFLKLTFYIDTEISQVYEERKDSDGFLYITYTEETTLG